MEGATINALTHAFINLRRIFPSFPCRLPSNNTIEMLSCDYYQFFYHPVVGQGREECGSSSHRLCKYANASARRGRESKRVMKYDDLQDYPLLATGSDSSRVRVIVISDTHEAQDTLGRLPPCDILIHAGDILTCSSRHSKCHGHKQLGMFGRWFAAQPAQHRLLIPGNHDACLQSLSDAERGDFFPGATFLFNESIVVCGLRIWGSPLSYGRSFNQAYQAEDFCVSAREQALVARDQVDILITHGPCEDIRELIRPGMLHVSGHIHAAHGCSVKQLANGQPIVLAGGPIMDRHYDPVQPPVVIDCCFCAGDSCQGKAGQMNAADAAHPPAASTGTGETGSVGNCSVS